MAQSTRAALSFVSYGLFYGPTMPSRCSQCLIMCYPFSSPRGAIMQNTCEDEVVAVVSATCPTNRTASTSSSAPRQARRPPARTRRRSLTRGPSSAGSSPAGHRWSVPILVPRPNLEVMPPRHDDADIVPLHDAAPHRDCDAHIHDDVDTSVAPSRVQGRGLLHRDDRGARRELLHYPV